MDVNQQRWSGSPKLHQFQSIAILKTKDQSLICYACGFRNPPVITTGGRNHKRRMQRWYSTSNLRSHLLFPVFLGIHISRPGFALPRRSPLYTILTKYYSSLRMNQRTSDTAITVGDIHADYRTTTFLRKREWQYTKSSTNLFSVWKTGHTLVIDKFSTDNMSLSAAFDMVCNPDSA